MRSRRRKKAGLVVAGLALAGLYFVWQAIKLPFKAIGWAWRHKVAAALIAVAGYIGWGHIKPGSTRSEKRAEMNRIAVKKKEKDLAAWAILNHTLSAPVFQIQTPVSAREEKTLSPPVDQLEKLPAFSRLDTLLQTTAQANHSTDHMGTATVVFCDGTNAYNAVMVRLGYVRTPMEGKNKYEIFRSSLVSDKGKSPLSALINIRFPEEKGVRFGLSIDEKGVRQVQFKVGAPIVDLDGRNGRTLLAISNNQLRLITDPKEVDRIYGYLNLNQAGAVYSQKFRAYTDTMTLHREYNIEH